MAGDERKVLVVEDEALVAMLVEDALLDAGFGVMGPAATVEEAMNILARERPDAVVLDLNLAGETSTPGGRCPGGARHSLCDRDGLRRLRPARRAPGCDGAGQAL
jgi:CheY-like chemotaxis protein